MRKRCFKCKRVLPVEEFYEHPAMGDGRLGKCKDCAKGDVRRNYKRRRSYYSEYDQHRNKSVARREAKGRYLRAHRARNPMKAKARNAISNAIRDGRLVRQPCQVCGAKAQGAPRRLFTTI